MSVSSDKENLLAISREADGSRGLTLLFLAANPSDTARLSLDEEAREIEQAIQQARGSVESGQQTDFKFKSAWATRPRDLLRALNQYRPDIVHFSGHGSRCGEILLSSDQGVSAPVPGAVLRELFKTMKDNIQAVVLNCCYSDTQARAIAESIGYVVGMNTSIEDGPAVTFATHFYSALAFGRGFPQAFEQAKLGMLLAGHTSVAPVLLGPTTGPTRASS